MDVKEEEVIETVTDEDTKKADIPNKSEVAGPAEKVEKTEGEIEKILEGTKKVGFESALPKEYQEEAKNFSSLKEYLKHLHDGGTDTWEELEKDESMKNDSDMIKFLKNSGMTASNAKKFVKTHRNYEKAGEEKMKAMLDDTMKGLWGADYEKNKNYMTRGMEVWKNKELARKYPSLLTNPIVADLLSEIGRSNGAPNLMTKGTPIKDEKKNADGPKSRFGIDFSELIGR